MTRTEKLIYAAGLFDGEGCIGLYNTRTKLDKRAAYYQLVFRVTQKTPLCIEVMLELWDGNLHTYTNVGPNKPGPYYSYRLTNKKAEAALKELLPYLREKKSQAEMALEFCTLRRKQGHQSKLERRRVTSDELAQRDEFIARIRGEKTRNFGMDYFN